MPCRLASYHTRALSHLTPLLTLPFLLCFCAWSLELIRLTHSFCCNLPDFQRSAKNWTMSIAVTLVTGTTHGVSYSLANVTVKIYNLFDWLIKSNFADCLFSCQFNVVCLLFIAVIQLLTSYKALPTGAACHFVFDGKCIEFCSVKKLHARRLLV